MAERGDSSDEEPTIAEDVVVTKYQMAADMANRKLLYCTEYFNAAYAHISVNHRMDCCLFIIFLFKVQEMFFGAL